MEQIVPLGWRVARPLHNFMNITPPLMVINNITCNLLKTTKKKKKKKKYGVVSYEFSLVVRWLMMQSTEGRVGTSTGRDRSGHRSGCPSGRAPGPCVKEVDPLSSIFSIFSIFPTSSRLYIYRIIDMQPPHAANYQPSLQDLHVWTSASKCRYVYICPSGFRCEGWYAAYA